MGKSASFWAQHPNLHNTHFAGPAPHVNVHQQICAPANMRDAMDVPLGKLESFCMLCIMMQNHFPVSLSFRVLLWHSHLSKPETLLMQLLELQTTRLLGQMDSLMRSSKHLWVLTKGPFPVRYSMMHFCQERFRRLGKSVALLFWIRGEIGSYLTIIDP
jgi:hypothetical protein